MSDLDRCIALTLEIEGKWSDHPFDRGGKTKYGVIEATLDRAKLLGLVTTDAIEDLTATDARKIYEVMFWYHVRADVLPRGLAALIFDIEVNHGAGGLALQQSLNYLGNIHRVAIARLAPDNKVGGKTLQAVREYVMARPEGEYELLGEAYARRDRWWDNDPQDEHFGMGWNRRGSKVLIHAVRLALGAV